MTSTLPEAISAHAAQADRLLRRGFGPRVRKLHARIGAAHRQAEGMVFSRALLEGQVQPLQLVALLRALAPAYALLEQQGPAIAAALGSVAIPWGSLARSAALAQDLALLETAGVPPTPVSAAAALWCQQLQALALQAPHRLLAHGYVRYGGDLSGGQQLAAQAQRVLAAHGLPSLSFWQFDRPLAELKQQFHDGIEQLQLTAAQEDDLLEEAVLAFHASQRLLAELAELSPAAPRPGDSRQAV